MVLDLILILPSTATIMESQPKTKLAQLAKERGWGPGGPDFDWREVKKGFEEGEIVGRKVYSIIRNMTPSGQDMMFRID